MHELTFGTLSQTIALALAEDLGRGDLTTEACVSLNTQGRAEIRAREAIVYCGGSVVEEVLRQVDPRVVVHHLVADGELAKPGQPVTSIAGPARAMLMGERVALNYTQRLSAIATLTRSYVSALPDGSQTRIVDTRKTTPGLRILERYAVRCGGGHNHREDLGAAVLIKDNHIAAAGSIRDAIHAAKFRSPHTSRVTCEVDTLEQLSEALDAGADIVMLDNFDNDAMVKGIAAAKGRALIEASGGITKERVHFLAEAGVDVISVGALTHSAGSVDLGLDWLDNDA